MTSAHSPPALDEALRPLEAVHRLMTALHRAGSSLDAALPVELAMAGHPLPMKVGADGSVAPVGMPGSLLGVEAEATATTTTIQLLPEEALVCVTDGVLQRRH